MIPIHRESIIWFSIRLDIVLKMMFDVKPHDICFTVFYQLDARRYVFYFRYVIGLLSAVYIRIVKDFLLGFNRECCEEFRRILLNFHSVFVWWKIVRCFQFHFLCAQNFHSEQKTEWRLWMDWKRTWIRNSMSIWTTKCNIDIFHGEFYSTKKLNVEILQPEFTVHKWKMNEKSDLISTSCVSISFFYSVVNLFTKVESTFTCSSLKIIRSLLWEKSSLQAGSAHLLFKLKALLYFFFHLACT